MAAIEYSYVTSITTAATGATGIQYFPIGPAVQPLGTVFVIKRISFYSTTGIGGVIGVPFNYILYASDDNIGTGLIPLCCSATNNLAAFDVINPFANNSFYVEQPFLGLNVNITLPGIIYVLISYCLIANNNIIRPNFDISYGSKTQSDYSPILGQQRLTSILTSMSICNIDPINTYTVSTILSNLNIYVAIGDESTLAPYGNVIISQPIYIPGTASFYPAYQLGLGISGNGTTGLNYYLSSLYNIQE